MPVTLADIAQHADVSLSTVSRVLNNKAHVSASARAAVLEAIQVLGYSRQDARREEHLDTVLLLVHEGLPNREPDGTMAQDMERLMVAGAQTMLRSEGIHTQIAHKQLNRTEGFILPHVSNLAGAINIGGITNPFLIRHLQRRSVPVVMAGASLPELTLDNVTLDFRSVMLQIVTYLVKKGRRRIALVNGPRVTISSIARQQGLRMALALHDLDFVPAQAIVGQYTFSSGDASTRALLDEYPQADALIYGDDDMAVGGLRALRALGRHVPEDIAVVGMYDYDIASYTDPPLTTVKFDKYEMGRTAALRLHMRMQGIGGPPWSIVLPTELVERESA